MNQRRNKEIKHLKKKQLWPSIMFLLIYITFSIIGTTSSLAAILSAIADSKISQSFEKAQTAEQLIESRSDAAGQQEILDYLESTASYEGIYILDINDEPVAGFGEKSFVTGNRYNISLDSSMLAYADSGAHMLMFVNDQFDKAAIRELFSDTIKTIREEGTNTPALKKQIRYTEPYWAAIPLSDTGKTVILKTAVELSAYDIALAGVCSAGTLLALAVPLFFLYINVISNIHSQRRMMKILYTDPVTGGNNWTYFEHYADKTLRKAMKMRKLYAVVDISWIKYRNFCAYHGTSNGEAYLEKVDKILCSELRRGEKCALYGKSSFALLLRCNNKEECEERVKRIVNGLPAAIGHESTIFHGGIYFSETLPQDAKVIFDKSRSRSVDAAELYSFASSARASIADDNHCGCAVFDRKLLEDQIWEHKVEERMHKALANEEFKVYIQPKYDPVTEKLAGAEALVRWINDEDGFVSPGRFIPIFEKNGFITQLDDYMISHVAALQAKWLKEGKEIVPISVNVSRAHFADTDLANHIASLVDEYKVPHHFVEIELTESAFFDDKAMLLSTVKKLKDMGFDISMDDFGAGYSSLNSLKDLPLDVLKLDAEFFRGENSGSRGEIVVSEAIELAKKLNMRTVAEGVEKKDQVEFLAQNGCDMIQGYYYSKPVPADEYEAKLG